MLGKKIKKMTKKQILKYAGKEIQKTNRYSCLIKEYESTLKKLLEMEYEEKKFLNKKLKSDTKDYKNVIKVHEKELEKLSEQKYKDNKKIEMLEIERKDFINCRHENIRLRFDLAEIETLLNKQTEKILNLNKHMKYLNNQIEDLKKELNDEVQISISANKNYYDKKIELEELKSSNKQLLKQVINNLIRRA